MNRPLLPFDSLRSLKALSGVEGLLVFLGALLAAFLALALSGGGRRSGRVQGRWPWRAADAQTLRIALKTGPRTLDPVEITDAFEDGVAHRIFNGLVRYGPDLRVVPDLAEKWAVSADGLTYAFTLRRGVRFHNGRELTAEDVVYSLSRLADPARSRRFKLLEAVGSCRATGAASVEIRLLRPQPQLLELLAMSPAAMVPREEVERLGRGFARAPVGTGPFRLVEWVDNDHLTLERFGGHFAGAPRLAALVYRVIAEPSVRFGAYQRGDVDISDVPPGKLRAVSRWTDFHTWPGLDVFYLGISFTREPCASNVHLRRALNWAVDRERLCRVTLEGGAVPAKGVLPPGLPGYNPELKGYRFDPAAARRELELAGYPGGRGLAPLALFHGPSEDARVLAVELQQQFRRAGIPVELNSVEFEHLKSLTRENPPALFRMAWVADYPDPENFLWSCFHSSLRGASNRARYASPEADRLLEAAAALPGGPERLAAFARAEEQIVADAPWVFLYHQNAGLLVKPGVRGLSFTALDTGPELPQADFVNVWKEE
jgi:peptide/nickel transport system substrate-binding protein/oligopeptide transport system substrate-binding protein